MAMQLPIDKRLIVTESFLSEINLLLKISENSLKIPPKLIYVNIRTFLYMHDSPR